MDGWIKLRAVAKTAVILKELRRLLEAALETKIQTPSYDLMSDPTVVLLQRLIAA